MANRCCNELEIFGKGKDIQNLVEFVKSIDSVFDFNNVLPYIEEDVNLGIDGMEVDDHFSIENNWRIENWGTKWNATDPTLKRINDVKIIFEFDTAWDPSIPVTLTLSSMYPDLIFIHRYQVSRMDYKGIAVIINGDCVKHIQWAPEDFSGTDE